MYQSIPYITTQGNPCMGLWDQNLFQEESGVVIWLGQVIQSKYQIINIMQIMANRIVVFKYCEFPRLSWDIETGTEL